MGFYFARQRDVIQQETDFNTPIVALLLSYH